MNPISNVGMTLPLLVNTCSFSESVSCQTFSFKMCQTLSSDMSSPAGRWEALRSFFTAAYSGFSREGVWRESKKKKRQEFLSAGERSAGPPHLLFVRDALESV